ncbi:MAG TPA: MTAP family purine nucleoside phosphorylase [Clostridia bacterium]|nr:MTAP family purine nucleoside phosphorylase [Clostridia bacterium]
MVVGIITGTGVMSVFGDSVNVAGYARSSDGADGDEGHFLECARERVLETPFGVVRLFEGLIGGRGVVVVPRHGPGHNVPPHRVPYRALVWVLRKVGVTRAFGVSAVGAVNGAMKPGDLVVADQLVDFTKCRGYTFYEGSPVVHVDMTYPYCPQMRSALIEAASGISLRDRRIYVRGSYFATEGPRYETRDEIRVFRLLGADMVGMTGSPEAVLCREAGICYSLLAVVTNPAAGLSGALLDHKDVTRRVHGASSVIKELLREAVSRVPAGDDSCVCPAPLYRRTFDEYILNSEC